MFKLLQSPRLRVLMYHNISADDRKSSLIVTAADFEKQLRFLQEHNYNTISLRDLTAYIKGEIALPDNPVLLTFDDGYQDNYSVMYPILKKYNMKAGIFLVSSFIQQTPASGTDITKNYLSIAEIKAMEPSHIQFGLHTVDHKSYGSLTDMEKEKDVVQCQDMLAALGITYEPCMAYTYGNYPKRNIFKRMSFFKILKSNKVNYAFRIGNRLNRLPLSNRYLIQRIDVKGNRSFEDFVKVFLKGKPMFK